MEIPLAEVKALHSDSKAAIGAIAILSVVYVVGVIMFQIWTIIVANKARKEIDEGQGPNLSTTP